jgi:hypothetical protein
MAKYFLIFIVVIALGCAENSNNNSVYDLGDIIAKGNIKDSLFNGHIKFYEKKSGLLVKESNYTNNILNGKYRQYYSNGNINIEGMYSDGKPNGYVYYFDSTGKIISQTFLYYGIRTGPSLEFINNQLKKYYYFSLENEPLFYLDYDSIGNKGILDLATDFFFITQYSFGNNLNKEYRIYNINPPKYNFQYSIVIINYQKEVLQTLKVFNDADLWHSFQIDDKNKLDSGKNYALKILINDSINNKNCTVIKAL